MELTSKQRVARLRARHVRERYEKSSFGKMCHIISEINRMMDESFPRRWEDFKGLLALGGLFVFIQLVGCAYAAITGQPLNWDM